MTKYGYARVSTTGQDLTAQLNALTSEGCEVIYKEKFTGTKTDRPEFVALLKKLQPGDTLVVTKLDRFARSTKEALETVEDLFKRGIRVHSMDIGVIDNTPTGELIFTIFSAFAKFERDLIVTRTQEGKAIAKLKEGFTEGRPKKYSKKHIENALKLLEENSYNQVEEMTGISKSTLVRAKRNKNSKIK